MSIPVIETCLKEAGESDKRNMVETLYRKLHSAETEDIMEDILRKVLPCGVQTVFESYCLNKE